MTSIWNKTRDQLDVVFSCKMLTKIKTPLILLAHRITKRRSSMIKFTMCWGYFSREVSRTNVGIYLLHTLLTEQDQASSIVVL